MIEPGEESEGSDETRDLGAESEVSADPEVIDPMADRVRELESQLLDATGRLRAVSKAYREQQDEMNAFRERIEAQNKLARSRREFEVVKAFFEPVQNLQRSLDAAVKNQSASDDLLHGIQMIHQQFMDGLTRLGLQPIPGIGAAFDPNLHEALAVMPVADPSQDGKVQFVHLEGFMVDGKPVQPAQVVIGKHEPASADPT